MQFILIRKISFLGTTLVSACAKVRYFLAIVQYALEFADFGKKEPQSAQNVATSFGNVTFITYSLRKK